MSVRVWVSGSRLTSESCPVREKTCSIVRELCVYCVSYFYGDIFSPVSRLFYSTVIVKSSVLLFIFQYHPVVPSTRQVFIPLSWSVWVKVLVRRSLYTRTLRGVLKFGTGMRDSLPSVIFHSIHIGRPLFGNLMSWSCSKTSHLLPCFLLPTQIYLKDDTILNKDTSTGPPSPVPPIVYESP